MAKFGKWIGGGLGWAFLGPLGGLLGFALGAMLDNQQPGNQKTTYQRHTRTTQGDFLSSLIVLIAAVMKSDGRVLKSELDFVKNYLIQSFGISAAQEAILLLRDVLEQNIPTDEISRQIARYMDYSSRLQLMHLLYGVCQADGMVSDLEVKTVERIAYHMGIRSEDFQSLKGMREETLESAYAVLEVNPDATDEELKKAYRKMAVKYHPDKVAYLGEEIRASANEKFQKLNQAWEKIKKARGIN
ncbi:MAG: DnaJ domain-containing protein [Bacteroidales bacterium]|nr:DnaJ domain-containing protein [Bacteroidales bacterium]